MLIILGISNYDTLLIKTDNALFQEFSPGSNGRMTTMGVYIRDLLLGQVHYLLWKCAFWFKFFELMI